MNLVLSSTTNNINSKKNKNEEIESLIPIDSMKNQIKLDNYSDHHIILNEIPAGFQRPLPKQFTLKWFKSKILYDLPQSYPKHFLKSESIDSYSTTNGNSGKHSNNDSNESFYVEISNETSPIIIASELDDGMGNVSIE
jgi:hypothetical protein